MEPLEQEKVPHLEAGTRLCVAPRFPNDPSAGSENAHVLNGTPDVELGLKPGIVKTPLGSAREVMRLEQSAHCLCTDIR